MTAPVGTDVTGAKGSRPTREQKFAPQTHLYYQGRLSNMYLNWQNKTQLVVIPHQKVFKLTEMYPLDLGYLFQEIYSIMEQKRIQNFTLHIFKRDWDVAPHLFIKVGMPQDLYQQFAGGPHINAGAGAVVAAPAPTPPPLPPEPAPTSEKPEPTSTDESA